MAFAQQAVGTTHAGITLHQPGGRFTSLGVTHPVVEQADQLQYQLREGPCVDVAVRTPTVVCPDVGQDPRWPRWAARPGNWDS